MKQTILFLAANPSGTDRLALDREARAIQAELERSGFGDHFELETRWAVEPLDLLRALRRLRPTVVHFSGHGSGPIGVEYRPDQVPCRDVVAGSQFSAHGCERSYGLYFQGPDDRPQIVSTAAITETFGAAGASVKLVVLNACYTEEQADALLSYVDCVVGISGAISDATARSFAIGFYGGLGEREPIAAAFRQGRAAISLEGLPDDGQPQLKVRAGLAPGKLVLATPTSSPADTTAPHSASRDLEHRYSSAGVVNHVEHGVMIQGNQIVNLAPHTTEQEREARYSRLERKRQIGQDRLYHIDPKMKHRHSETTILSFAGVAVSIVGAAALAFGQVQLGIVTLVGVGIGMYYVARSPKLGGPGR